MSNLLDRPLGGLLERHRGSAEGGVDPATMPTLAPTTPKIRLAVMADVHGEFARFHPALLPEADAAVVAGDITERGTRRPSEVAAAREWLHSLAARYQWVYYVGGNHDVGIDNDTFALSPTPPRVLGIERRYVGHHRSPWQFWGQGLSPCFDLPHLEEAWVRMTASEAVDALAWSHVEPVDVVVSHCPPYGLKDEAGVLLYTRQRRHIGSPGLRAYIDRHAPALVVCGHAHEASGHLEYRGRAGGPATTVVNCARWAALVTMERDAYGIATHVEWL